MSLLWCHFLLLLTATYTLRHVLYQVQHQSAVYHSTDNRPMVRNVRGRMTYSSNSVRQILIHIKWLICEWSHNPKTRKRKSRPMRTAAQRVSAFTVSFHFPLCYGVCKRVLPPGWPTSTGLTHRVLPRKPRLRRSTEGQGSEQRFAMIITFKKSNKNPPVAQQML